MPLLYRNEEEEDLEFPPLSASSAGYWPKVFEGLRELKKSMDDLKKKKNTLDTLKRECTELLEEGNQILDDCERKSKNSVSCKFTRERENCFEFALRNVLSE